MKRFSSLVLRALLLKCPHCGKGAAFASWFNMRRNCPNCGLRLMRHEGFITGSMTFNIIASQALLFLVGGAVFALTWPNPPWTLLQFSLPALMIISPLVFFPFSRTLWLAFDLLVRPLEPRELPQGEAAAPPERR